MRCTEEELRAYLAKGSVAVASSRRPVVLSVRRRQPITPSLPLSPQAAGEAIFPVMLANKANTYRIIFHPRILGAIAKIKQLYRGGWLWRITPSAETKAAQEELAQKLQMCRFPHSPAGQAVAVSLRVIGRRFDADAVKIVLDALEDAGIVDNDNQVKILNIRVEQGEPSLGIQVERIEEI